MGTTRGFIMAKIFYTTVTDSPLKLIYYSELLGFWTSILENGKHDASETGSVSVLR
jgi:hypothetical protein